MSYHLHTLAFTSLAAFALGFVLGWLPRALPDPFALMLGPFALLGVGLWLYHWYHMSKRREQYIELVEKASSIIMRINPEGKLQYMNDYGLRLFRYRPEEVYGKSLFETILPEKESTGRDLRIMMRAMLAETSRFTTNENENIAKDGHLYWIRWDNHALLDGDGMLRGIVCVGSDITDRKKHEEELHRLQYTISHDLRTPLVTITTFVGMLEEAYSQNDLRDVPKGLNFIRHAASRMGRLLNEFQEISRVGRRVNPPTRSSLTELVDEACALVAGQLLPRGIAISVQRKAWLTGDHPRLVEVFEHLLENSAKFMGEQESPSIQIGIEYRRERPFVYVRDNGIGIEPEYLEQIFTLFSQIHPQSEGTGLGLALVQRIIEVHHGRVWAESPGLGQGTTIYFCIENLETEHEPPIET